MPFRLWLCSGMMSSTWHATQNRLTSKHDQQTRTHAQPRTVAPMMNVLQSSYSCRVFTARPPSEATVSSFTRAALGPHYALFCEQAPRSHPLHPGTFSGQYVLQLRALPLPRHAGTLTPPPPPEHSGGAHMNVPTVSAIRTAGWCRPVARGLRLLSTPMALSGCSSKVYEAVWVMAVYPPFELAMSWSLVSTYLPRCGPCTRCD